jgi:hypothetical protein
MSQPSNSTLLAEIRSNHSEVVTRLGAVEEQVKHTNGRVKKLELWKARLEGLWDGRKENAPIVQKAESVNVKSVWFTDGGQKVFLAIAGLITAIAIYVTARGGL